MYTSRSQQNRAVFLAIATRFLFAPREAYVYVQEAARFVEEEDDKKKRLKLSTGEPLRQRHTLRRRQVTTRDRIALTELSKLIRREVRNDINEHHRRLVEEAVMNCK
ncbi:hypothetical protein QR680_005940 [Steinernema hermaphroditum]|uniref:Uncharacterized protein n=1 Tax=Steinernema hermaphroditum TaxID=289476 RepID=A0AA39HTW3_9BILA|nr:hypothetical protein QR680_005940 [Steinernema hermaphroditum]